MMNKNFNDILVIENTDNYGFSRAVNIGIKNSTGEYILLVNSDAYPIGSAIFDMINYIKSNENIGVIGPFLENEDGSIQESKYDFPKPIDLVLKPIKNYVIRKKRKQHTSKGINFLALEPTLCSDSWLTGAVLLVRRRVFHDLGLLDENYFFMMEDVDFCLGVSRSKWELWMYPPARFGHQIGGSRKNPTKELEVLLKTKNVYQQNYYIKKNYGYDKYILCKVIFITIYTLNIFNRFIQFILIPKNYNIFKLKLSIELWKSAVQKV